MKPFFDLPEFLYALEVSAINSVMFTFIEERRKTKPTRFYEAR